ncbi:hypothetical protein [Rhodanobacter hydrolyticus]|uniref:Uncharacterized protein n=1 Tax=Rhodanobacter hydrolyticus TaxID=2250595 RepID=A0ABW8J5K6_9GAMM
MSRRERIYTVTDDNRDKGRSFLLKEMPATQGEWWAFRAFVALARGGVELPEDLKEMGMAGVARLTLSQIGKMSPADAKPLMDELYRQVQVVADPKNGFTRELIEDDIDEIATHFKLKWELIKLHAGFSEAAKPSTSA